MSTASPVRRSLLLSHPVSGVLVAAFVALLLSGCSSQNTPPEEEFVFTADDAARFDALIRQAGDSSTGASLTVLPDSSTGIVLGVLSSSSVGTVTAAPVDPAVLAEFAALRMEAPSDGREIFRVTNEFVNLRSEPNKNGGLLGRLDRGTELELKELTNAEWAKVKTADGREGYTSLQYIAKHVRNDQLEQEKRKYDGLMYVNFAFLNVRSAPDRGAEKVGELPGQSFIRPSSINGEWAQIPFNGGTGYVSAQYLAPFIPRFTVRQEVFTLPVLLYRSNQQGLSEALKLHIQRLKDDGWQILTFRDLAGILRKQETQDVTVPGKAVLLGFTDVTAQTVKPVSDALLTAGTKGTLFIQTDELGLSGITQKTLSTLLANGFDIQSAGHTGDDLRALTNGQLDLELRQSRLLLDENAGNEILAIAYPQSGLNDRVIQHAAEAGYLFGVGGSPERSFSRSQMLRMPSLPITTSMSADEVSRVVLGL